MAKNSIPKLVGSVLLCEAAGGTGSVFAYDSVRNRYPNLEKPSFNPPSWVFGPVWTLLYAMMGGLFLRCLAATRRRRQRGVDLACPIRDTADAKRVVDVRVLQA